MFGQKNPLIDHLDRTEPSQNTTSVDTTIVVPGRGTYIRPNTVQKTLFQTVSDGQPSFTKVTKNTSRYGGKDKFEIEVEHNT